ncbi:ATP-dependent helicase Lhr [Mycobacteroides abscessus subsp. abscessus]|uniref:ATP-dependent helicase n=1 Tax=Mycobacteroides abscessus TaxID=36809 RepID=UPI00092BEC04|nr:ATP-dependent helicase [Mycobacteroides abscessus]SHT50743.1 ATP-dependent helicase Lhr [Mycobacteroides abscessus subsp. abscessus]SHW36704.1 ATP-dependent helicase Lhr [Mycobacteroides abscessus subsp. abscessus]SIF87594.1 ATP-dependent helicase Lhr [Mycobacteroides abscessus subsp. abscessus]SKD17630.1 ATP-dependent helicase Lhr [Mycobacteroides abscessus subsp. abscessus]SKM25952.1 ATP-dependent helicase Lhr [Mycobacteroides abscessus subsp. abscessus]
MSSEPGPLARFSAPTREWFTESFPTPTRAQSGAWQSIANGDNTLVIAPTGSGKTLAAFLWAIDTLVQEKEAEAAAESRRLRGSRVLYVSPLKALAVDVERNLRAPLAGIARTAARMGLPEPAITIGVRSGDTPAQRRRTLISSPPDILITTPESLYLMLTSAARETLDTVRTVIVDEVHAVAGTKRGAHLALSLERLDERLSQPAQRIGLSATVKPAAEVARFLSGRAPATVVAPASPKTFDLSVVVPVSDMSAPESFPEPEASPDSTRGGATSLWPHVEQRIVDLIEAHRSSIVFANSRRLAERLTARFNEIHAERLGLDLTPMPNPDVPGGPPAHIMGSGQTYGAAPLLARAHHGSVSKEQRADIEDDLKTGRLKCVVATSSLELGIDMGAVDLVVQVEAPPSVASGLQRIGRAGHQVGEVSRGVLFPKHRTDLLGCAVTVRRMLDGDIETLQVPANPLDILAQHTVAACALESMDVEKWFDVVRRSAPFTSLPRSAFDAVLDLLSGKYPSTDFAELRPRVVYDRDEGTLTGRPGAQRLAVTSGGAIPDRGLFTVYMYAGAEGEKPSRVGELDEEMVYESRPGDVISLGATSWRITEITHERVVVVPAFGQPGRLPFWRGDSVGRPAELGIALGQLTGELASARDAEFDKRCAAMGFDDFATGNLRTLLTDQLRSTGAVPTDTTLIVERFRDELGDWRIVLHCPYGLRVNGPLALAISDRLQQRYGVSESPTATDDGIVVRLPDTDDSPPGADLFVFDAAEIESIVTREVGGSALFAARFRECAARALLLPRRTPGRRSPLWQQRQRAAQLLDVARKHSDFPMVLEALRECLQDVYDIGTLVRLMSGIEQRRIRIVEVQTDTPSPFAAAQLFSYIGGFMYDEDRPLAERRAAALSLDTNLLAELMGRVELRELLDPAVIDATERQLQHLAEERKARDAEALADLFRLLGPLTAEEIAQRCAGPGAAWLDELVSARRVVGTSYGQRSWWAAVEDVARLRDALGVPVPPGVPAAFTDAATDPLAELLSRYARTHGPFTTGEAAQRFGLGVRVAADTLSAMAARGQLVRGEFTSDATDSEQWCDAEVLRILRRRSLAALRAQVEPVSTSAFARFLPDWQYLDSNLRGIDGVATVIEQLAGVPIPASAWEPLILARRIRDYSPQMLDELLASGEAVWSGQGSISAQDGWIALHPSGVAPATLAAAETVILDDAHRAILNCLTAGGGYFFRQFGSDATRAALWDLVWAGQVTGDTFAPVRALLGTSTTSRTAHRNRRAPRLRAYTPITTAAPVDPAVAGRWSMLPERLTGGTERSHIQAELLLGRYGVVTKGSVVAESVAGGFAWLYKVLSTFEDNGRCRRGYFVESLGGAQFASPATVDRLREYLDAVDDARKPYRATVLAATDPANPYGAALVWPRATSESGHRPGRKAGALAVLVDGDLALYIERGGKSLLSFVIDPTVLHAAALGTMELVRDGGLDGLVIERIDGRSVFDIGDSAVVAALMEAGFARTPRGLRIRR